jgi:hypothetical protein
MDVPHENLLVDQPTVARLRPRRVARFAPHRRALRTEWVAMWAVHTLRYGPR